VFWGRGFFETLVNAASAFSLSQHLLKSNEDGGIAMDTSQHAPILHLTPSGGKPLSRISLFKEAGQNYDENWLQQLVFKHPECLPLQELDPAYGPLIPVCREMETGAGPVDIVFVNQSGMLTLVECKLWRNPEARREVIGQILDYAKELGRWQYEDLQREVSKALKKKGNQLFEIVKESGDMEEAVFVDNVSRNLRDGRFQLIIIGDGIRQGVERIAEYLKGQAGAHFSFGLVEVAVYRMLNGDHLLQPRILAKTSIIDRYTIQLSTPEMKLEEDIEEDNEEITEVQQDNKAFWESFLKQLRLDDVSQGLPTVSSKANIWFMMPKTKGHVWINVYRAKSKNQIGVFLRCMDKSDLASEVYLRLKEQKSEIDAELETEPSWEDGGKRGCRIAIKKRFPMTLDSVDKGEQIKWLSDYTNRFVNVFRPRVEEIGEELQTKRV